MSSEAPNLLRIVNDIPGGDLRIAAQGEYAALKAEVERLRNPGVLVAEGQAFLMKPGSTIIKSEELGRLRAKAAMAEEIAEEERMWQDPEFLKVADMVRPFDRADWLSRWEALK